MIHAIGWLIKTAFFAAFILVLGNWVHWGGRTVSEQVKNEMKQVERSRIGADVADQVERLEGWTKNAKGAITTHVSQGISPQVSQHLKKPPMKATSVPSTPTSVSPSASVGDGDKIPPSERQKLRALIQELNTSTSAHLNSNE